jgi:hypothetical protein
MKASGQLCPPTFLALANEPQKGPHSQSGHGSGNKTENPSFCFGDNRTVTQVSSKNLYSLGDRKKGEYKNKKYADLFCL